ncbi:MAG: hypothetical protein AAF483_18275 [Planctomycetota bacterium]
MPSYEELKAEIIENDDEQHAQAEARILAEYNQRPTTSGGIPGWVTGALAIGLVLGIYFGLPAFVDSRDPGKSRTHNRVAALQWFFSLLGDEPRKSDSNSVGSLDAAFK